MDTQRSREARARRAAARQGFMLRKDRGRTWTVDRQGGYMLVDAAHNVTVAGSRWDLDLDGVESFLSQEGAR